VLAPYASMMDFVDLARRASSGADMVSLSALEFIVRCALEELATDDSVGATLRRWPGAGLSPQLRDLVP
jgi:hypothetical protein